MLAHVNVLSACSGAGRPSDSPSSHRSDLLRPIAPPSCGATRMNWRDTATSELCCAVNRVGDLAARNWAQGTLPMAGWEHDSVRELRLRQPRSLSTRFPGPRHSRLGAPLQRQGERHLFPHRRGPLGRAGCAPRGRLGPHQRLRPHPVHPDPGQGQGPDRPERLVVRATCRRRSGPPRFPRRPRPGLRARHDLPAAGDVPGGVRGPRLPHRFRPGRVPGEPVRVRRAPARGPDRGLPSARADLHPRRQGRARRAR